MRKRVMGMAVLALALGTAGAVRAQDVSVDWDRDADFSCRTYAWSAPRRAADTFADRRIVKAVDGALAAHGWRAVTDGTACFSVRYDASLREERQLQGWGSGGPLWRGAGTIDMKTTLKGTLVVDIARASTHELVWRGVARDAVAEDAERNQKKLARAMEKMFHDLPTGTDAAR